MEEDKDINPFIEIYRKLYGCFGPQGWWPTRDEEKNKIVYRPGDYTKKNDEEAFEIITGAILTQNTSWKNVEKALNNLKDENLLFPEGIKSLTDRNLQELIRPAGYFKVKAGRLKNFIGYLYNGKEGKVRELDKIETARLRKELLNVKGIGNETADSILLYAFNRPSFVVDAYTRRIFSRLGLIKDNASYAEIKNFFEKNLPLKNALFNEYHALLVKLGKNHCKKKPSCTDCPLTRRCNFISTER